MSYLRFALLLATPVVLSGCNDLMVAQLHHQKIIQVTYQSDPPGAMVSDSNRPWGRTPVTLRYTVSAASVVGGRCIPIMPITVRWPSGATAGFHQVCVRFGPHQIELDGQLLAQRPANAPGLEQDVQFAAAYEKAQAQIQAAAQMAAAAENAANLQALATLNAESAVGAAPTPSRSVQCASRTVGQGQYAHT